MLRASVLVGALSGAPSTIPALVTGRSPLDAARAAGELLGRAGLLRGAAAHAGVTVGWTLLLDRLLPRRHRVAWGATAGLAIAALDLSIAERRFPAIAALPRVPQVADHLAFGALVGAGLGDRPRRSSGGP